MMMMVMPNPKTTLSNTNDIQQQQQQQQSESFNQVIDELSKKFQHQHIQNESNNCLNMEQSTMTSPTTIMIHNAAINNDLDLMKKLLLKSDNQMDENYDENNKQRITQLIDCRDSESNTSLLLAALNGHREMVQFLLDIGASINVQNFFNNTALHEAAWKGFSETLEILCNNYQKKQNELMMIMANDNRNHNNDEEMDQLVLNLHLKNKQGHTALHLAAQKGHNQSTRVLLLAGCKPNVKNNFGDTPLHSASRYGHVGVVRILISAFANVNELNKNDDTALHIAAAMNRKKLAKILLENGCNPTIVNRQGETPMNIALRKSYFDIQELIASPPPLKLLYRNISDYSESSLRSRSNNELYTKSSNRNQLQQQQYYEKNHHPTRSETYSCDQLNKCMNMMDGKHRHHIHNHNNNLNDDDDHMNEINDLYGNHYNHHHHHHFQRNHHRNHFNELKRCKSDFSAPQIHSSELINRYRIRDPNEQKILHTLLSRVCTPTTQAASSIEPRNKQKSLKKKNPTATLQSRRTISPAKKSQQSNNSNKYRDSDSSDSYDDVYENPYGYNHNHNHHHHHHLS
nr:ankyrin repeat domain-containing protein 6-like [Dermatophagoides farinae]